MGANGNTDEGEGKHQANTESVNDARNERLRNEQEAADVSEKIRELKEEQLQKVRERYSDGLDEHEADHTDHGERRDDSSEEQNEADDETTPNYGTNNRPPRPSPPTQDTSKSWNVDMDLNAKKYNFVVALSLFIHLGDYAYGGTSPSMIPLRMMVYVLLGVISYFTVESGGDGLSPKQGLIHYTALVAFATFVIPLLALLVGSMPTLGFQQTVLNNLAAIHLLLAWFPLYFVFLRGMDVRLHGGFFSKLYLFILNPVKWVKWFYIVAAVLAVFSFGLSSAVMNAAEQADQQLPETPSLNPRVGVEIVASTLYGGAENFINESLYFIRNASGRAGDFVRDPLGTGYQTDVEENHLGVEVSITPLSGSDYAEVFEGGTYQFQSRIEYASQYSLAGEMKLRCKLLDRDGNIVRDAWTGGVTQNERLVGGGRSNNFIETCVFEDLASGQYTAKMEAVFPFKTQAYTEYYFASESLATDPARRNEYVSKKQALNADQADAKTTEGPVELQTRNERVQSEMPIIISPDTAKVFPYGFVLKAQQGKIVNISHVEMHLPTYFSVQEGVTCQIGGEPEHETKPGYKRVVFEDYLRLNQNSDPYGVCNVNYDQDDYDEIIWSPDQIQPVTFSVIAAYDYKIGAQKRLSVKERPKALQNDTGNNESRNENQEDING